MIRQRRTFLLRRHLLRLTLLLFLLLNTLDVLYVLRQHAKSVPPTLPPTSQRLYIASLHWNNEAILRSHWNSGILSLAKTFGPENIFVSVYESGSWDDTKGALRELDKQLGELGVRRNITVSERSHKDEISEVPGGENAPEGWIDTGRGRRELRRIPYLSRLRDYTLEPLKELVGKGERFDTVLFLNDVVFDTSDVLTLLNTNGGDYAAACSIDFSKPPLYYDTFALRDAEGHEHVMQTWPYFRARESRRAMKGNLPVPVKSCWNGMVAMPISPFLASPPLHFRGVPDSLAAHHLEGSECCLIHADNPLSATKHTYLNPRVRVGYNPLAYDTVNGPNGLMSSWHVFKVLWENRLRRWFTSPGLKEWTVRRTVRRWMRQNPSVEEKGEFCLINEMQVLAANGWAHV